MTQQYPSKKVGIYPKATGETPTTGTVTSVSVNTINGFSGTVNNPTTMPAINIQTTVTGLLKGNGVAISAATSADIITSNVLDLTGDQLTSIIDGISSNTITIPGAGPTTNSLINNFDNTITSTVDGASSTTFVVTEVALVGGSNFTIRVNGVEPIPIQLIDTVVISQALNSQTVAVNGVLSNANDVVKSVTFSKPDDNHITAQVNGVGNTQAAIVSTISNSTATNQASITVNGISSTPQQIVTLVDNTKPDSNHFVTNVNTVFSTSIPIVETNVLSLVGTILKETINGVDSNTINVQPLIVSPVANDLVMTTAGGQVFDSGISVSPSSTSNDNTHVMTSAATQTALANGLAPKAPLANPALTGTPTAPTPAAADNSTKIATTAYVDNAVATTGVTSYNLRSGAVVPVSGDYTVSQVTGAAPLASPTFTGTVTVPTPSNSTDAATKGYVDTGLAGKEPTITNLPANKGGTGITSYSIGDILYASSSSALAKRSMASVGQVLISKGPGNGPDYSADPPVSSVIASSQFSLSSNSFLQNIRTVSLTGTRVFTLPDAASNSVRPSTGAANQYATGISSAGVISYGSAQSITSSITFTNLDEIILLVAPGVDAVGIYIMILKDSSGNELDIIFSVSGNQNTAYTQSTLNILQVNDSLGVVTASNISSYLLFRGYVRNTTPNSYFVVTMSMPYTLLYTNPLSMTMWQLGASYLNENSTITSMITTNISNLVSTAAPDLSFKMKLNTTPVSISNPQGYIYEPSSTNVIFQFSINTLTGNLTALSPASIAMTQPYKLIVTNQRNYLYAGTSGGTTIFMFRISATNGTLSALSTPSITTPSLPTGMAIDPTDRFLYACFDTGAVIQVYTITKATGILVFSQSVGAAAGMRDCVVHQSGKWLYAFNTTTGNIYQFSIDLSTGNLTPLSPATVTSGTTPLQMCLHPNGKYLYIACSGGTTIFMYGIDQTTGLLTPLSPATFTMASNPFGVTVHPNGNYIFVCLSVANQVVQCLINPTTGLIVATGPNVTVNGARHSCFDYTGTYLSVINTTNNRIDNYIINSSTGAFTANGNNPAGTNSNSINVV